MILTFDPHRYISEILLVGCGGTGAQLARSIARIARMMLDANKSVPTIRFIDPDIIEKKNVGRQLYTDALIDQNKAIVLARRFNMALGLEIEAIPEAFDPQTHKSHHRNSIILGAVDNWQARRSMAEAENAIYIDCGNDRYSGQVVMGTTGDYSRVISRLDAAKETHAIRILPNVAAVFPELLKPDPDEEKLKERLSCAELLERSLQSAMINGFVANVAGEYLRKLLYREDIRSWITYVDTRTLTVRSTPITAENILSHQPCQPPAETDNRSESESETTTS